MQGGTFSLSIWGIGGTSFTPLVNAPESPFSGFRMEPVFKDGRSPRA
jgi:pyruvate/2-oxoglutarate dehydrogenase complex dihydrolipoamide acyltransferase (E2) component